MPSIKNPNKPSKSRAVAQSKARKAQKKRSALGKAGIDKSAARRGARPGLLPTSGPGAALSSKKKRKLEKRMAHALKRKMEAEGEVVMKDAPAAKTPSKKDRTASGRGSEGAEDADEMEIS